jgi:saccharopine dehydrogenase-like NADP-dependent oxidoreductase
LSLKVLVLGGYGNFGARICRALAGDAAIDLLIAGRSAARADALAASLPHSPHGPVPRGAVVDVDAPDLTLRLRELQAGLVIHTAGPFQAQDYRVAQACAEAGAHYIDLADGRRFVVDFAGRAEGVVHPAGKVAITGASTVPALSSAVIDHLCTGWQGIDSIDFCIAPAQTAPRGEATMAAVLSYCGADIEVWHEGRWTRRRGWAQPRRVEFARLKPRLGALCDIPDLELFPAHYGVRQRVMFRAALEVGATQRALAVLAALRTAGVVRRPQAWAGWMVRTAPLFDRFGSSLGGMVVEVRGRDAANQPISRSWHIAADNDHGPEIPCMAAILLARQLAHGEAMPAGARPCLSLVPLAQFEPEFARWGMVTDVLG